METTDAARGRALVERWCALAEQRLEYLTELFDTGRWRRFFTEVEFLENIHDARAAVDSWRELLARDSDSPGAQSLAWLGYNPHLPPRPIFYLSDKTALDPPVRLPRLGSPSPSIAPDQPVTPVLKLVEAAPEEAAEIVDDVPAWQHALDPVQLEQRYPLLRKVG